MKERKKKFSLLLNRLFRVYCQIYIGTLTCNRVWVPAAIAGACGERVYTRREKVYFCIKEQCVLLRCTNR